MKIWFEEEKVCISKLYYLFLRNAITRNVILDYENIK